MIRVCLPALFACLRQEVKALQYPGIDGVSADMVIDGVNLLRDCLVQQFNCMLAT